MSEVNTETIRIEAPPEVVFPYFTEPALLTTWFSDRAELDPRPGGVFALHFGDHLVDGTYVAVEPPHRVVFTWGAPTDELVPTGSTTVEVRLRADGDDTVVELTHRDLPHQRIAEHRNGWQECLGRLPAAVAGAGAGRPA
jgi:uncharacterized protein YndB with AHSA1/START domain